ncbi:receptor-like protein 12, partial [Prunus avium]
MESLISLDLSNNNFSGQLLDLHSNSTQMPASLYDSSKERLVGPIPLHLNELFLYNNSLTGTIPSWLYILPSLEALSLSHNQLTGNVKEFQSSSLVYLNFGHNRLHGQIPRSIFEFPNLGELDLSSNNFSGFVKFGKFPKPQNLLRHLYLSNNSLTGIEQVFPWKNLQVLDLRTNLLQGQLPIPPPSTFVFLVSHNQLTGGIPSKICNLSSLVVLDLSNNNMRGEIPPCIGNLTSHNLSVLDLHMNKFLGVIPSTFTKDSILRNLDLNGNKLEGPLPQTLLNCRKLEVLDLGNNEINDTFPNWLESLPTLQ